MMVSTRLHYDEETTAWCYVTQVCATCPVCMEEIFGPEGDNDAHAIRLFDEMDFISHVSECYTGSPAAAQFFREYGYTRPRQLIDADGITREAPQ